MRQEMTEMKLQREWHKEEARISRRVQKLKAEDEEVDESELKYLPRILRGMLQLYVFSILLAYAIIWWYFTCSSRDWISFAMCSLFVIVVSYPFFISLFGLCVLVVCEVRNDEVRGTKWGEITKWWCTEEMENPGRIILCVGGVIIGCILYDIT